MPTKSINANELKRWLDNGEALLVDVREPQEFASENIPGAVPLPLAMVSLKTLPAFARKKLVMQCRSGVRSATACERLLAENPSLEVYNLEGGILAWAQAGLPITTPRATPAS